MAGDDRKSETTKQKDPQDFDRASGVRPVGRVATSDFVFGDLDSGTSSDRQSDSASGRPRPGSRQGGRPTAQGCDDITAGAAPRRPTERNRTTGPSEPVPSRHSNAQNRQSPGPSGTRRPSAQSNVTSFKRSATSSQTGRSTSYSVTSNRAISSISAAAVTSPDTARPHSNMVGGNCHDQFGRDDRLEGVVLSDDFQITRMVGFGGYGRVYKAEQFSVGKRAVAIKVLHAMHRDRPATIAAFKREVTYLAMLRSSCFPRVIRTGLTPSGLPYFGMEFISGKALDSLLKSNGPLDINRSVFIMDRVCEGIVEMHRKDIVHRDIKPGNVIIEEGAAKQWTVWMLDLGCAKPAYEQDTNINRGDTFSFGSPPYMAPETVIEGTTNEQSDIYSLGCMAYELLTGVRAIHLKDTSADSYFAYLRNTEKPVPTYRVGTIVPELPEVIEQVIHKALVRNLNERYSSVMEFRNAFVSAAGPYLSRLSSMAVDFNKSSNVSDFFRKNSTNTSKNSGLAERMLLRFKKG